jgi:NAD(P)-dependent dehydrogenase (short-subunit alcohol dehydrogenase family)
MITANRRAKATIAFRSFPDTPNASILTTMPSTVNGVLSWLMNVRGKVAIATSASAGIGLAVARLIANKGAKLALAARFHDKFQELRNSRRGLPSSFAVITDMSDAVSVERMVAAVHGHYGRIDALINNAARGLYGILEKVEIASYRAIWPLNGPLIAMEKVILLADASTGRRAHLQHQLHGIQESFSPHRRVRLNKIRPQRALRNLFCNLSRVLKP